MDTHTQTDTHTHTHTKSHTKLITLPMHWLPTALVTKATVLNIANSFTTPC